MKQIRRVINIDKTCFDALKKYCDENGLKPSKFVSMAVKEEISRRNCYIDPLRIKADDTKIMLELHELFYKTLDIYKNLSIWTNNIIKNGNSYVELEISPEEGITSYKNYESITRMENGNNITFSNENKILESFEVLHFRNLFTVESLPYGVSIKFKEPELSIPSNAKIHNGNTIRRLCRVMDNELTRAAIIHLYSIGYRDDELINFKLEIDENFLTTIVQNECNELKFATVIKNEK